MEEPLVSTLLTDELLSLFEEIPHVMFAAKDKRGKYVAVNQTFVNRSNRTSRREVIGKTAKELFVPALAERYEEQDEYVLKTGKSLRDELEVIRTTNGKPSWYVTTKIPLRTAELEFVGVVTVSRDLLTGEADDQTYWALSAMVDKITESLVTPPHRVPRIADLVRWSNFSESSLERHIRRIFGVSPKQFILKIRMDRALELLTQTSLTIAEIAATTGFYDQPAFTKQFARLVGETPAQYRRRSTTVIPASSETRPKA